MVQQGDFTLELVEAETKVPYKEHYKDGKTYVEVEPNAEYFIAIRRVSNSKYKSKHMLADFFVDEQLKGYRFVFTHGTLDHERRFVGTLQRQNGSHSRKALQFVTPSVRFSNMENDFKLGSVQARVHAVKGSLPAAYPREDCKEHIEPRAALVKKGQNVSKAKVVMSTGGSVEESFNMGNHISIPGELLETITLYYCTVPGLMQAGVLPKPPKRSVEEYLMTNPQKQHPLPKLEPKRIRIAKTATVDGREVVTEERYCDSFDLTDLQ